MMVFIVSGFNCSRDQSQSIFIHSSLLSFMLYLASHRVNKISVNDLIKAE